MDTPFRGAVIQMQPCYLDPTATLQKMIRFIRQAAEQGAHLVVFPEVILSGYPNWIDLNSPRSAPADTDYWERYVSSALSLGDPLLKELGEAVRKAGIHLVTGFVERDSLQQGVIYNSSLVMDRKGAILGTHRKLTPVKHEMLFYRKGDAQDVRIFETSLGRVGVGICAEHFHPLYKYRLAQLGEELHCALWVNVPPLRHVVDCTARAIAVENGTFVLLACQVSTESAPDGDQCELRFIGGSGILSPWGEYLTGPLYGKEGILVAELDPRQIVRTSATFRLLGRDHREDLFQLHIRGDTSPAS